MMADLKNLKMLSPEVDYQALMAQMQGQTHPRRKLAELQNKGYVTRLKKGFYVLAPEVTGREYSPQIVANLLYGPSYISLEYALSYFQLIPERVEAVTSVTTQKNKTFQTKIGRFTYEHLASTLYPIGVCLRTTSDGRSFLMATPEKALMDIFTLRFKKSQKPSRKDIAIALNDDLRLDLAALKINMNVNLLTEMKSLYKNRHWGRVLIEELLEAK